ncbi:hypothetical protein NX871_29275, partial [Burkholderia thailandensis]|uniref:hypothetical protein n=1 Tax=Burkholderia thailandensis TaxID=57975 RepID=UPI00217EBC17
MPLREVLFGASVDTVVPATRCGGVYSGNIHSHRRDGTGDSLTRGEGPLSAFHQNHVRQGALGTLVRAVEDMRLPPGSKLTFSTLERAWIESPAFLVGPDPSIAIREIGHANGGFERRRAATIDRKGDRRVNASEPPDEGEV